MRQTDFAGRVDDHGKLHIADMSAWRHTLRGHCGKPVNVSIARQSKRRSDLQNKYYWGVIIPYFSEWSGYRKHEAHETAKAIFLKTHRELPRGKIVEVVRDSKSLTTAEFADYCGAICNFLADQGVNVPAPNEPY